MGDATSGFEPSWLEARRPFDDAALDRGAVRQIRDWAARQDGRPVRVVDLGSGTGGAIRRALRWLRGHSLEIFAVDKDSNALSHGSWTGARATERPAADPRGGSEELSFFPVVADVLQDFESRGGPPDGSVDLVLAHAVADLVPIDALSERVAALLRPGGLAHVALTYDGETRFRPADDRELETRVIDAYHRHMDRRRVQQPSYGGSTAGRRVAGALEAVGLKVLRAAPSIWAVRSQPGDGVEARVLQGRMVRFVKDALAESGTVTAGELRQWETSKCALMHADLLSLRVCHVDVLATRGI